MPNKIVRRRDANGLLPIEALFVDEYMVDRIPTKAYRRARPNNSARTAHVQAGKMMARPVIRVEIERRTALSAKNARRTLQEVIAELELLAFSNIADYTAIGDDGRPYVDFAKVKAMPEDERRKVMAAISEIGTESIGDLIIKSRFKLHDKRGALVDLGRHLGMKSGPGHTVAVNTTPGGATTVVISDDPVEAARAYQKIVGGS